MLLKFKGPLGPLINPKLKKAVQVGELFECDPKLGAELQKVAPLSVGDPTEEEAQAYYSAKKASDEGDLEDGEAQGSDESTGEPVPKKGKAKKG